MAVFIIGKEAQESLHIHGQHPAVPNEAPLGNISSSKTRDAGQRKVVGILSDRAKGETKAVSDRGLNDADQCHFQS